MSLNKGDFVGGLLAGAVTGLGIGLLLAPRQGYGLTLAQRSETIRRLGMTLSEAAPLVFEAGLLLLTQTRPLLGRAAWGVVHLAGRTRPRGTGR